VTHRGRGRVHGLPEAGACGRAAHVRGLHGAFTKRLAGNVSTVQDGYPEGTGMW
jgi:hypothetical protein